MNTRRLKQISKSFPFKTLPYQHQRDMLRYHISRPWSAEWSDFGVGKSKVALDLIRWRLKHDEIKKAIILAPACVLQSWDEEIQKHTDLSYSINKIPKKIPELLVFSYDHLSFKKKKVRIKIKGKWRWKVKYILNHRLQNLGRLARKFPIQLILDESTKIKSIKAKRTLSALMLADRCKYRIIMSGVPIPNNLQDIWTQIRIMDGGVNMGDNFYSWRYKYFFTKPWMKGRWFPKETTLDYIKDIVQRVGIRFMRDECLDLPDAIYSKRYIDLTPEQEQMMIVLDNGKSPEIAGYPTIENLNYPMVRFTKKYEVANGFLYFDSQKKHVYTFTKNPKHTLAKEIINDWVQSDTKAVIYSAFTEQTEQLRTIFKDYNPTDKMYSFQNDKTRKLFINHVSQGVGITLHKANITMYLSNTFNFEDRIQSEARIRRAGQTKKQYYIDILAANCPVEERVYECLRNKQDVYEEVMG